MVLYPPDDNGNHRIVLPDPQPSRTRESTSAGSIGGDLITAIDTHNRLVSEEKYKLPTPSDQERKYSRDILTAARHAFRTSAMASYVGKLSLDGMMAEYPSKYSKA